jgi:hypothetical protein
MRGETRLLSARTVRWLDVGVVVWVAVWVVLGVLTWQSLDAQARLGRELMSVGGTVRTTGEAIGAVGGLPLVGGSIGSLGDKVKALGTEVETTGRTTRDGVTRLAVIGALAVGVLPAALALFLYLPVRVRWRRDVKAVADALPHSGGEPGFEQYLARRAIDALPWDALRELSPDPWRSVATGELRTLADAELRRLGLRRPGGA